MQNKVVYFEYSIESPCDDKILFPYICAVHLFNQLQSRENIMVKFAAGVASPDKGGQIINAFSSRSDVEFIYNKKYGGMIFVFLGRLKTNVSLLPLLQLDSIGTQYIAPLKPISSKLLSENWNISERKLIKLNLAKFICSTDQDRTLKLFFDKEYYISSDLKSKLVRWEQSICSITGTSCMEKKTTSFLGVSKFISITLH